MLMWWYIIFLNHTVKIVDLVSLNIKYLHWGWIVLYLHTMTLCHAIASNNKNHCSKNTFVTLRHRRLLNSQYSKYFLILWVFKSNSFKLLVVWWSYKENLILFRYKYIEIIHCHVSGLQRENFSSHLSCPCPYFPFSFWDTEIR